jgi:UDP-N-acetylglucosamine--N-acetylmuramyl-(pentapeptide) pyrophosphoryl-undecaprenol N-acetylglucosamine transferase
MDSRKASEHGIAFFGIPAVKISRFLSLSLILQPYYFVAGYITSLLILYRKRPEVIFCKGGGVALAPGLAARTLGIPLALHESDTRAGLTNRVLGAGARMVLLGFAEAATEFTGTHTQVIGQWIAPVFRDAAALPMPPRDARTPQQIIVQCGGLGSTRIFEALLASLPSLSDREFTIALGTKNEHFYEAFARFPNVTVHKWMDHEMLAHAYALADIALTRASANTLAEAQLFGNRIIMVPLGIAGRNHQYHNAMAWQWLYPDSIVLEESSLSHLSEILVGLADYRKTSYSKLPTSALESTIEALKWVLPWVPSRRAQ